MRSLSVVTLFVLVLNSVHSYAQEETSNVEEESELELETVTITAPKESKSKIDTSKLLKIPGAGNDPLQSVEALPGVTFSKSENSYGHPAVRGSSPKDNLYIVDFMPTGYVFHLDGLSVLNDNTIRTFSLESSAFESQYNNATGAVIDVESRSPYYDTSRVVLDLGFLRTGLFIETPLTERQSFYLSIRRSLIQYYMKILFADDPMLTFTTFPNYYDYQAKYEYKISDFETLNLNFLGSNDEAETFFKDEEKYLIQDSGRLGKFAYKNKYDSQSLVWEKLYNNGLQQKIGVSRLVEKFQEQLGKSSFLDNNTASYNFKSQFSYNISERHEIQWGLEYKHKQIAYTAIQSNAPEDEFSPAKKLSYSPETVSIDEKTVIDYYDFNLGDKIAITQNWDITPSFVASYENYTKQTFVDPRLQTRYELSPRWALTGAYGKHHQFQNFQFFAKKIGNPKLKQETADHYEIGLENNINENWLWKIEGYYKELNNLTTARLDRDFYSNLNDAQYLALPRYDNNAKGKAWGAELFINKTTKENWYGWLSLAYAKTERTHLISKQNFRYKTDLPWILNLVINYRSQRNWEYGLKWRLQSGQLITPIVGAKQDGSNPDYPYEYTPIYGEINSLRVPFYNKIDLRAQKNYRFNKWELGVYFDIMNAQLFPNVIDYYYSGSDYSNRNEVYDFPGFFAFGLKATF